MNKENVELLIEYVNTKGGVEILCTNLYKELPTTTPTNSFTVLYDAYMDDSYEVCLKANLISISDVTFKEDLKDIVDLEDLEKAVITQAPKVISSHINSEISNKINKIKHNKTKAER